MSFTRWLQKLASARARQNKHHLRRRSARHGAIHWLRLEPLEDRRLLAFSAPVNYMAGASPQDVLAADFNNDIVQDLAVANYDGTVSVLRGTGDGTFQPPLNSPTGSPPLSLAVGDFNDDGTMDLATANYFGYYQYDGGNSDMTVLLGIEDAGGNGTGTFASPVSLAVNAYGYPSSVAVGDFNGDGLLDLGATASYYDSWWYAEYGSAHVLLGSGGGDFSASHATILYHGNPSYYSNYVSSGVAADVDGDGFDDLVTVVTFYHSGTSNVLVLLGNSSGDDLKGRFVYSSPSPGFSLSVATGDLDDDGDTDLVVADSSLDSVSVRLGDGAGNFVSSGIFATGDSPGQVVLGDFTGDGKIDIATGNHSHTLSVLAGGGDGTFSSPVNFAVGMYLYGLAAADFNGDGWLDAAWLNSVDVAVLINDQNWADPPPPLISIDEAAVTEGNTGSTNATFTVRLSAATNQDVTVHFNTADDSATAGSDYIAASGDVTILAGSTTGTFTVAVLGDRSAELTENFAVTLSAPVNATLSDGQAIGTITDDEPTLSIADASVFEGASGPVALTFLLTLSGAYDADVTVSFATQDGTATTADNDYQAVSGTTTIAAGATMASVMIHVNGDQTIEADETLLAILSNANHARFVDEQAIGTIRNDDAVTKFYVVDASSDKTFEYDPTGAAVENYGLRSGNNDPRGAASDASGQRVWVIDNDDYVYAYDAAGNSLGAWKVNGLSTPEGIASDGTDLWIVDRGKDRVYRFAGGANRTSGSVSATSSFTLNSGNRDAKGIETDGTHLWVVNDASTNKVFKYTLAGALVGSWTISGNNTTPTGITLDPSNPSDIWIVDSSRDQVFQYTAAASRTGGSQSPSAVFNLASGNSNPQGIADPPPAESQASNPTLSTGSSNLHSGSALYSFSVQQSAPSTSTRPSKDAPRADILRPLASTALGTRSFARNFAPGEAVANVTRGRKMKEHNEHHDRDLLNACDAVFGDPENLGGVIDEIHR